MARISDLLAAGPTLSFEFFAPRTPEAEERLERTLRRLAALRPSFMSVTYGALGAARGPTEAVVAHIHADLHVTAMPHLTCVDHTRDEIAAILARYRDSGIENLLALRGDLPQDASAASTGQFPRAIDLVAFTRPRANFAIGVAAHPERHPLAETPAADREHQATKLRAADFAITQFFFRTEYYERFVQDMQARGVRTPVIAGIMPPSNLAAIARMAEMNGTEFPAQIRARLAAAADDVSARREIAVEVGTRLGQELLAAGAPGLHLYTMNFSGPVLAICEQLGMFHVSAVPDAET